MHAITLARQLLVATLLGAATLAHAFDLQGHRGARGLAPENTLAAFDRALAEGDTLWVLRKDRTPVSSPGRYLVVVDTEREARSDWSPLPVTRKPAAKPKPKPAVKSAAKPATP